jgi:hypothetical protein
LGCLASSNLRQTKGSPGAAAALASKRKHSKNETLKTSNVIFKALTFETLGRWCKKAINFIDPIGDTLFLISGDPKVKHYLHQRISLAIQRENVAPYLLLLKWRKF